MASNSMYQPISVIDVYYRGFGDKRLIGKLMMDGRRPAFGYDAVCLADGQACKASECFGSLALYW